MSSNRKLTAVCYVLYKTHDLIIRRCVLQDSAKKRTKMYNVRAEALFSLISLIFAHSLMLNFPWTEKKIIK